MLKKIDQDIIKGFLEDSSNLSGGHADGAYIPENKKEIVEAIKECNSQKTPLTVSAGQTGTTGGCIPFGGWILTTQKLNKIIEINAKEKYAIVEPGVSLEQIEKEVANHHLLYAPDPTEKTATIGGNVSTNASGGRCFRFGSTRDHILGLELILPSGEILKLERDQQITNYRLPITDYASPLIKSSAGYYSRPNMDPIDLFIGSEGTLGIISQIKIKLVSELKETLDLVIFFSSEEKAVNFVLQAKKEDFKNVNFYEFFDANTLQMLKAAYPHIPEKAKAAVYIEQETDLEQDIDRWAKLIKKYGASIDDCWLGMDQAKKEELAKFRHAIPEHINELYKKHHLIKLATDIAVPNDKFIKMFSFYNSSLVISHSSLFSIKFGHIGDNHLHVNLLPKTEEEKVVAKETIMKFIKKAVDLGGTVSAEHGIGKIKHAYLKMMYGDAGIEEMRQIKKQFDPNFILGQNNIFPV